MKSDDGVILIEMLVSVVVVGSIVFLILHLVIMISSAVYYDQKQVKLLQVSSLIYDDIADGIKSDTVDQCFVIEQNTRLVKYCFTDHNLVRTVDAQGYERLINHADGRFTSGKTINLELNQAPNSPLPIWSSYEG